MQKQQTELQHSKEELEKMVPLASSSHYKSKFLADMSDKLCTPLSAILIYAQLLADNADDNLSEEEVGFASNIHDAGFDLLHLVNEVHDRYKVEAGRMESG